MAVLPLIPFVVARKPIFRFDQSAGEKFVPFSSWEFYIFTQIDSARWLGDAYGETDSRLFKLLHYLNVATVIHKWCALEH